MDSNNKVIVNDCLNYPSDIESKSDKSIIDLEDRLHCGVLPKIRIDQLCRKKSENS